MKPALSFPLVLRLTAQLALGGALTGAAEPSPSASNTNLTDLCDRIRAHLAQPRFAAARWGCRVVSLDTGATLVDHDAGRLFKPASNAKLFTAALALDRLGPDYRIRTSFHVAGKTNRTGTLQGDLVVYGRGDPGLAEREPEGDREHALKPLVDALIATGVRRVSGDLIGDESFFRGPPFGSGWAWEDLQYPYGAEVSSLTQADNTLEVVLAPGTRLGAPCRITTRPGTAYVSFVNRTTTTGSEGTRLIELHRPPGLNVVTVTGGLPLGGSNVTEAVSVGGPALWFVQRLKEELAGSGIHVEGRTRTVRWGEPGSERPPGTEIASVESAPVGDLVEAMVKRSSNLQAQLLLLQVGAVTQRRPGVTGEETTEQAGMTALGRFLGELGIAKSEVLLDEGSGLSQNALVTPNAIVELLRAMERHRHAEVWHRCFPVAGVDGTLGDRMKGTAAGGRVRAKTGSLRRTRTLSGYVRTASGERLVFSLMLNNHEPESRETADRDIDAIAVMLAEWTGRTGAP